MAAITWQNVNAPDSRGALQGMAAAQNSFNGAFDVLGNVLKQRTDQDNANWDNTKNNNTQAFYAAMNAAKTPEELAAAQESLQGKLTGYGAQIDPAAMNALDGRKAILENRGSASLRYTNEMVDNKEAPLRDAIGVLVAQGKTAEAQPLIAQLTRRRAESAQAIQAADRLKVTQGQADTRYGWDGANQAHTVAMQPGAVKLQQAQIGRIEAETAEKAQGSVVNSLLTGYQKQYTDSQANFTKGVTAIANELKIPVNKAGEPELKGVDLATAQKFQEQIKERLGDPVSSSVYEADFAKEMVKFGVPVKDQVTAKTLFGQMFNDGSVVSAADGAVLKAGGEKIDARLKAVREDNPFIKPKADDLIKQQGEVLGMITSQVKDGEFWTKSTLKEEAQELMSKGLTFEDANGKEVTRAVTPAMLKLAYQVGLEGDTGLFNSTNRNARTFLENMFKDPNNAGLQKKADEYEADPSGSKAKGDLLKSFRDLPGVQNAPRSLVNNLDAHIASSRGKAKVAAGTESKVDEGKVYKAAENIDMSGMTNEEVEAALAEIKANLVRNK